jgi:hypothetical protein
VPGTSTTQKSNPKELSIAQYFGLLGTKYGTRALAAGGPIAQPEVIAVFEPDQQVVGQIQQETNGIDEIGRDLLELAAVGDRKSFDEVANALASGKIQGPVIYKPIGSSLGHGIFFLEPQADGSYRITMSQDRKDAARDRSDRSPYIISFLGTKGIPVEINDQQSLVSFVIDPKLQPLVPILHEMWAILSRGVDSTYDTGMMERVVPAVTVRNGRAFETRFFLSGHTADGAGFQIRKETKDYGFMVEKGSLSRVGASGKFSNVGGRTTAERLIYPALFDPLLEEGLVPRSRRQEFEEHIDKNLRDLFDYLRQRLKEQGLNRDVLVSAEVDLMWLPPDAQSNGFPRPILNELKLQAMDSSVSRQQISVIGFQNPLRSSENLAPTIATTPSTLVAGMIRKEFGLWGLLQWIFSKSTLEARLRTELELEPDYDFYNNNGQFSRWLEQHDPQTLARIKTHFSPRWERFMLFMPGFGARHAQYNPTQQGLVDEKASFIRNIALGAGATTFGIGTIVVKALAITLILSHPLATIAALIIAAVIVVDRVSISLHGWSNAIARAQRMVDSGATSVDFIHAGLGYLLNKTTFEKILSWLARHGLGMSKAFINLKMKGLQVAVAEAAQASGTSDFDSYLRTSTPEAKDMAQSLFERSENEAMNTGA